MPASFCRGGLARVLGYPVFFLEDDYTDFKSDYTDEKMITQIRRQQDQLTRRAIGCCFQVHNALGPGFPERVYQSALEKRFKVAHLLIERERRFTVLFEGEPVGDFQVDFLIERRLILEVKAVVGAMPKVFTAQLLAYLKAAGVPVGLLVNFGNPSCQLKRMTCASMESALSVKSAVKSCGPTVNLCNQKKHLAVSR